MKINDIYRITADRVALVTYAGKTRNVAVGSGEQIFKKGDFLKVFHVHSITKPFDILRMYSEKYNRTYFVFNDSISQMELFYIDTAKVWREALNE